MKLFKVGGIELTVLASLDISQRYEPIGGETILRATNGRGILQRTWRKTRIVTSGAGWMPSGLQALDFDAQHVVSCVAPEIVSCDAGGSADLPAGRRSDAGHSPYAMALLSGGRMQRATVSMSGHSGFVDPVAGAIGYQIAYYPEFTCWILRPSRSGPEPRWELIAEEV